MVFEILTEPNFWVAVGTIALASVTFGFLLETRNMRIQNQRPSFAIEPVSYEEGEAKNINLVNTGQTASNIEANCMSLDSPSGSGKGLKHHIMSLSRDGRAVIELPVTLSEMKERGQYLKIEIKCKDVAGKDYTAIIAFDYGEIKGTSDKVAYQYNVFLSMTVAIKRMAESIRKIEEKLNKDKK